MPYVLALLALCAAAWLVVRALLPLLPKALLTGMLTDCGIASPLPKPATPHKQTFTLKHVFHHGAGKHHRVHKRLDITPEIAAQYVPSDIVPQEQAEDLDAMLRAPDWPRAFKDTNPFTAELPIKRAPKKMRVERLAERHLPGFLDSYFEHALGSNSIVSKIHLDWEPEEVAIPDVTDRDTVISLALISSNAYVRLPASEKSDWTDVGGYDPDDKEDIGFGWLEEGLRGHVFVSNDSKTVVIGIKGTLGAGLPGGGLDETAPSDKTNDNLLFSCCCARVGYMWTTVCDCYDSTYKCSQDCLERELQRQDRYYQAVLDVYRNVTRLYDPGQTDIWVTGHSLGGALALLLGRTYGLPAVAYEAPGELLALKRLHLPLPPGLPRQLEHIWHFGNTADPIFMGVCNGGSLACSIGGYAMESACHTGKICVYDTVTDLGWHVNLLNHRIHTVIDDVILKYNETATCVDQPPCRDCFNWRFISDDDKRPNEPFLPHPLKPRPTSTAPTTRTSSSAPTSLRRCLEKTWYGRCTKWSDE